MTFRELNLRIFRREPVDQVLWQPRIEHWYSINKRDGTLPERYRDMTMLELFDDLDCSVRGYWAFNDAQRFEDSEDVTAETRDEGHLVTTTIRTPVGDLVRIEERTTDSHYTRKYPVTTPDDMRVMEWIMARRQVSFDWTRYEEACTLIGDRGAPTIFIPRVNLMRIYIEFMGFENGIEALYELPKETEHLIAAINESDEALLDMLCACPIEIINFGDNVHQAMCPPPLFEKYVMPQYQRRNERLRAAGKKTYPHWDGDCGQLLPYAQDCGFDGIEAITPVPQGDVTLEQVRDGFGDRILLDGIPCTDFLFDTPEESLIENTRKCIEYFHPRLVLGISDEISPIGDIERVRMVSAIVAEYNG
ncbi:MAG: hypothetical protein HZB26_03510 [Candidatus Hydrogenedentes bacterium]|nr:hypothetical protein [Candidatus Hydrogenedentota bacterium]